MNLFIDEWKQFHLCICITAHLESGSTIKYDYVKIHKFLCSIYIFKQEMIKFVNFTWLVHISHKHLQSDLDTLNSDTVSIRCISPRCVSFVSSCFVLLFGEREFK